MLLYSPEFQQQAWIILIDTLEFLAFEPIEATKPVNSKPLIDFI